LEFDFSAQNESYHRVQRVQQHPGNMFWNDVQVIVRLDKSTFAGSGGEWQTTLEFDFSRQRECYHRVQRVQQPPGNMLLKDVQVIVKLEQSTFAGSEGEW
jgi:hypothetical protein